MIKLFLSVSLSALIFGGCKKQYACVCKGEENTTSTSYDKNGNQQYASSFIGIPIEYEEHTDEVKEKDAGKSCASKSKFTETITTTESKDKELISVNKEVTEVTCELK